MITHATADIRDMEQSLEHSGEPRRRPATQPHLPRSKREESPEGRAARIAAITRAVRNGTYDTAVRAQLGAEAFCDALIHGLRRAR